MNPPETNCSTSVERRVQFSSPHFKGVHFGLSDGSARFIGEDIDLNVYLALITRNGNEDIGEY